MSKYITPARLKSERGWTDGLIKKFLGDPDKTVPNPHYRSGPPMRLYAVDRATEAEATADWKAAITKMAATRDKLRKAALETADHKRNDLLAAIERLQVSIKQLPPQQLRAEAIRNYNDLWSSRGKDKYASTDASEEFLHRITHNFIRHHLVTLKVAEGDEYHRDTIVRALRGRVGKNEGYSALWEKVAVEIHAVYPELWPS